MHGPRAAVIVRAPRARIAVTVAATTPSCSPRQPPWAAAITPASLENMTGAQSAVTTTNATPVAELTRASPTEPAGVPGTTRTVAPWTWRSQAHSPSCTARRASADAPRPRWPSERPVQRTRAAPRAVQLLEEGGDVEVVVITLELTLAPTAEAERLGGAVAPGLGLVPAVEAGGDDGD